MPVRSLTSSVLKWPSSSEVEIAARRWATRVAREHPEIVRLGVFGSYARGDAGVGSDLDIVAIVCKADTRPELRARGWNTTALPVPVDLLVYTEAEWARIHVQGQFAAAWVRDVTWLVERDPARSEAA